MLELQSLQGKIKDEGVNELAARRKSPWWVIYESGEDFTFNNHVEVWKTEISWSG